MDIHSKEGTKVVFVETDVSQAQISYGNHSDPCGVLEVGKIYTIQKTDVRSGHTKVYLKEFQGMSFNSVWFRDINVEDVQLMLDTLMFYGDPDSYSAITLLLDPPCGDFAYDFDSETEPLSGKYNRKMPGRQAREALEKIFNKY